MQKETIQIEFKSYDQLSELKPDDQELLNQALLASEQAYAPYSKFYVGAALRLDTNQIILGNNQENASYPCGICAERNAIHYCKANHKNAQIKAIAITTKNILIDKNPATPCGLCRQVLAETENNNGSNIKVILGHPKGRIWIFEKCIDLIPFAFKF